MRNFALRNLTNFRDRARIIARAAGGSARVHVISGALIAAVALNLSSSAAQADGFFLFRRPQKRADQIVGTRQPPARYWYNVLDGANCENTSVVISLSKQRVYLIACGQVAVDSPISSGKPGRTTPRGRFSIMEKDPNHFSSLYGDYVDRSGRVVRAGVSEGIDSRPSGTHFEGAPMRFFMRLTSGGVGMHIGILPGYAASHGCVRLPADAAQVIYSKVKVGTPVRVDA
jgi:lipoprotein-anchoring transpeptidase ErfK/SrfK